MTAVERKALERNIARRLVLEPLAQADVDTGLEIDVGSARRYVAQEERHHESPKVSAHWGEDLAAWKRIAVEKRLPDVGQMIQAASIDEEGMALGNFGIAVDVAALPRAHPDWDDHKVAWSAYKLEYGDSGYADHALRVFEGLRAPVTKRPE